MEGADNREIPNLSGQVVLWSVRPVFNGNYSSIYHGRLGNKLVAAKVLKEINGANFKTMHRKLHRERTIWGRLRHPNVLPLYGFAECHELFKPFGALISPWRAQGNAAEFLKTQGQSMSTCERINLWKGVVTGVEYLHNLTPALVHGDLKPANVLIDNNLTPQICDFGLVSIFLDEGTNGMNTTSPHTGTDRYLSYELMLEDEAPTMASDIFALGGIGLECVFLRQPYDHQKNNRRICLDIRAGVPPAKRPEQPGLLNGRIWDLLSMCWARNATDRINAQDLLAAVKRMEDFRHIMLLPTHLWLEVIDHLRVTDILHFRAVSHNSYRIVSLPVVWKRLLRKIGAPLPFQARKITILSSKDMEDFIKRALLLDINWKRNNPTAKSQTLHSPEHPYMVRMLPGGKWLVAATQSSEDQSTAVVVWDLDNPEDRGGGCVLLAKCRTRTRVSQMVVRYMSHKDKQGIAIATLRALGDNPDDRTEVCVIHISLEALEILSANQDVEGPPFNLVELHKTRSQVAFLNLEGTLLSVVHRPRTLMFLDLETKQASQLKLPHSNEVQRNSIQGSKILPLQNQVLVVRQIYEGEYTSCAFELYELPPWDTVSKEPAPLNHHTFAEAAVSSFAISHDNMARQANSDRPTARDNADENTLLAPISIFAHTLRPRGIIHWQIEVVAVADRLKSPLLGQDRIDFNSQIAEDAFNATTAARLQYVLPAKRVSHYWFEDNDQRPNVLPGADRSVFWTRPLEARSDSPPMRNLLAYCTKASSPHDAAYPQFPAMDTSGHDPDEYAELWGFPHSIHTPVSPALNAPDKRLKSLRLTEEFINAVQLGTQDVAFDEWSGMLCIAAGQPTSLYLLDYGAV